MATSIEVKELSERISRTVQRRAYAEELVFCAEEDDVGPPSSFQHQTSLEKGRYPPAAVGRAVADSLLVVTGWQTYDNHSAALPTMDCRAPPRDEVLPGPEDRPTASHRIGRMF
jgi:hypothetical protein